MGYYFKVYTKTGNNCEHKWGLNGINDVKEALRGGLIAGIREGNRSKYYIPTSIAKIENDKLYILGVLLNISFTFIESHEAIEGAIGIEVADSTQMIAFLNNCGYQDYTKSLYQAPKETNIAAIIKSELMKNSSTKSTEKSPPSTTKAEILPPCDESGEFINYVPLIKPSTPYEQKALQVISVLKTQINMLLEELRNEKEKNDKNNKELCRLQGIEEDFKAQAKKIIEKSEIIEDLRADLFKKEKEVDRLMNKEQEKKAKKAKAKAENKDKVKRGPGRPRKPERPKEGEHKKYQRPSMITETQKKMVINMYIKGVKQKDMVLYSGLSKTTIIKIIDEAGIPRRRGGSEQ